MIQQRVKNSKLTWPITTCQSRPARPARAQGKYSQVQRVVLNQFFFFSHVSIFSYLLLNISSFLEPRWVKQISYFWRLDLPTPPASDPRGVFFVNNAFAGRQPYFCKVSCRLCKFAIFHKTSPKTWRGKGGQTFPPDYSVFLCFFHLLFVVRLTAWQHFPLNGGCYFRQLFAVDQCFSYKGRDPPF